jgi:hypothetical protein
LFIMTELCLDELHIGKTKNHWSPSRPDDDRLMLYVNGKGLQLSSKKDIQTIVSHLAQPGAVLKLAMKGQEAEAMSLIAALPPSAQITVLSAPLALRGLTSHGERDSVLTLIEGWPRFAQRKILVTPYALQDLGGRTMSGAQRVVSLVKLQPATAQKEILNVYGIWELEMMGQAAEIKKIKSSWAKVPPNTKTAPFRPRAGMFRAPKQPNARLS